MASDRPDVDMVIDHKSEVENIKKPNQLDGGGERTYGILDKPLQISTEYWNQVHSGVATIKKGITQYHN